VRLKSRLNRGLLSGGLVALTAISPAAAQDIGKSPAASASSKTIEQKHDEAVAADIAAGWATAPVEERETSTAHRIVAHGRTMKYHSTAGTLTLRDDNGKPVASIFYVAYTLDGAARDNRRPITFFYNGGPGSSSIWLHMGSFAPMRVQTAGPETIKPAPYAFGPNPDTLLDQTDMVFVDAPGTGFSRALGDAKPKDFWGVDQDVDAFAKAIMRYVSKNGRWNTPKFLFGESYGTTRSAALAYALQDRGMALNGVILLSSILNYGVEQPGYDIGDIAYLPSFATTAWYHHKLANPPADVAEVAAQARAFARGPYTAALARGQTLSPQETDQIANRMSALTGLSADFIKKANLRVSLARFQKELLRDQRLTVGRFDSRYTGIDSDAAGERPETDASDTAISGAFIATFRDYLTNTLGYRTEMPYQVAAYDLKGFDWDWKHKAPNSRWDQQMPDVALDLAAAMRANPYLKVLSLNGYYDMATPFFGTEYDLDHMMLEPQQQQNIEFRYYPSGHMVYLNPDALHMLHRDLADFYNRAVNEAAAGRPPVPPSMSSAR